MRITRAEKIVLAAWAGFLLVLAGGAYWVVAGGAPKVQQAAVSEEDPGENSPAIPMDDALPEAAAGSEDIDHTDQIADEAEPEPMPAPAEEAAAVDAEQMRLYEDGPYGPLPVVAENGARAWQRFANKTLYSDDKPRIAVILTGIGLGQAASESAIRDLPSGFTLAFSPYGRNVAELSQTARMEGHELLLMVPMEPLRYPQNDPGPDTLLRDNSAQENIERLHKVMGRLQDYVGLMNDMGSSFTANEAAMRPVLDEARSRGLMFVDAKSTNFSIAASLAKRLNMPVAYNNRFIDQNPSRENITAMLDALVVTAKSTGSAVGLARPLPITVTVLREWAAQLEIEGDVQLVGISAIANRQPIR